MRTFRSIKHRLIFWFLIISLSPLMISTIVIYNQRVRYIKEEAFEKLTAIRDLKVKQITRWIEEKEKNVYVFSQAHRLRSLEISEQIDSAHLQTARDLLNTYQTTYRDFDELFIVQPGNGRILVSTNRAYEGLDKSDDPYFTVPMSTRTLFITDIYYSQAINKPSMAISIPVFSLSEENRIIGIMVGRIDLKDSLDNFMLERTGMGDTGETLIVNKELMALNELRHYANAPLNLKINDEPAVLALKGETGITETADYRGKKVLSAYSYIPAMRWGFVAKQDLSEVYAPIDYLVRGLLMLFVLAALAVIVAASWISKIFSDPVRKIMVATDKIANGNLAVRVKTESRDEIGLMSQSINNMAETIASQIFIQQEATDVVQVMTGVDSLDAFTKAVLKKLMELTDSPMGVFYTRKLASPVFNPIIAVGANAELLRPFNAEALEGEFGIALTERKISRIRNLPNDTVFQFKTFAGDILPKEIITIPILQNGFTSAMICLANLHGCQQEVTTILESIWPSLNTAYANFLAAETTQRLADALSEKNQELEAQTEELRALTEELQHQSEELRLQNIELDAQKQQVESANRLKSQFLANMSHELRTPLNAVLALSKILIMQTRETLSEEHQGYLEIIERNGRNLLDMINGILDLAKIESGRVDLNPADLSIGIVVETVIEGLDPLARQKGLNLSADIPGDLPLLRSDETRLFQILQNLVGNAIRFTEQGSVKVSLRCDDQRMQIHVEDTGIGVAKEDLATIFDEFTQVDGSPARRFEGTGLGLTIARKAAMMLGGEISAESTPGKGSVFLLTLPLKWPGPEMDAPEPACMPRFGQRVENVQPSDTVTEQRPRRVLIVEDSEAAVIQIQTAIEGENLQVLVANDGRTAMKLIATEPPDAILLDLMVPELDGFEILKRLGEDSKTAKIPVLVISARDLSHGERKLLQSSNVFHIFRKGDVDFQELKEKIRDIVTGRIHFQ